jgi:hypothetical protein
MLEDCWCPGREIIDVFALLIFLPILTQYAPTYANMILSSSILNQNSTAFILNALDNSAVYTSAITCAKRQHPRAKFLGRFELLIASIVMMRIV